MGRECKYNTGIVNGGRAKTMLEKHDKEEVAEYKR